MGDSGDDATKQDKPARQSQPSIPIAPDFGPRYRVIGMLGKGGMGEVFRAYDTELKGEVALKTVRADHESEEALVRFRREIALARKVTSPNVLRVYDLAEHAGLRFLTMEYVEGEDLGALMRREGKLPIERAIAIFKQVCQGLAAAHAQGVVHRDLKPQNVLVTHDDHVRVADFGLARSIAESGLTASGAIMGSPAYMSPEQVKGDPTDERSDIYSLGIMLYQLVAGRTPFRADTPHGVMEMRLHKTPVPLRQLRADVPAELEAVCAKCLALAPSERFASIKDVLAALDGDAKTHVEPAPAQPARRFWLVPLVTGVIAAAGATAIVVATRSHEPAKPVPVAAGSGSAPAPIVEPPADAVIEVLVFGFENRAHDPAFDGTIENVLASSLRMSKKLDPIAGVGVREFAGDPSKDPDDAALAAVARQDHVRVIAVRGSIAARGAGFTLAITARDVLTGKSVFEQSLDAAALGDVVRTTARLASGLRGALGEQVPEAERERTGLSANLDADHAYAAALAMHEVANNDGELVQAQHAIALDPQFARAHALLADTFWNLHRPVDMRTEFEAGLKAIDQMGERDRLLFLADYYTSVTEENDRAIATYEQILATWPRDLAAETVLAQAYQGRGDIQMSVKLGERAARDHSRNATVRANLVEYRLQGGDFEGAIAEAKKMFAAFSRPVPASYLYVAIAQVLAGHRDGASASYRQFEAVEPSLAASADADFALAEGRLREARTLLDASLVDDNAKKLVDSAEIKHELLAELELRRGNKQAARGEAALVAKEPARLFAAALVQLAVGDDKRANATAARFATDLAPSIRALAKQLEAEALRLHGKPTDAMIKLAEAIRLSDQPFAHFMLARAALDAKQYAQAYSELQTCLARRGEAAIGVDDIPTLRYIPLFTYYLAKTQDAMGSPEAGKTYQAFLAMQHDPDADDVYAADAKKHVQ